MNYFYIYLLLITTFVMEIILAKIMPLGFMFNFLALMALIFFMLLNFRSALVYAFISGILIDVYSLNYFGSSIIALFVIGYFICILGEHLLRKDSTVSLIVILTSGYLFYSIFSQFINQLIGNLLYSKHFNLLILFNYSLIINAIIVLCLAWPLFYFINYFYNKRIRSK